MSTSTSTSESTNESAAEHTFYEPAFTVEELNGLYDVHVRIEWKVSGATRGDVYRRLTLEQVEALFEKTCNRVVNNRLTQVMKVEVKARHKVLFMQRFEDGVRL